MSRKKENGAQAHCHFCPEPVSVGEFCHGCGHHICVDCDAGAPIGEHDVEDHQLSEQDDFQELNFNDED